jgi:hypothetical protein
MSPLAGPALAELAPVTARKSRVNLFVRSCVTEGRNYLSGGDLR